MVQAAAVYGALLPFSLTARRVHEVCTPSDLFRLELNGRLAN